MAAEVKEGSPQPRLMGMTLLIENLPRIGGSAHRG
jgi:hypothetical protein